MSFSKELRLEFEVGNLKPFSNALLNANEIGLGCGLK